MLHRFSKGSVLERDERWSMRKRVLTFLLLMLAGPATAQKQRWRSSDKASLKIAKAPGGFKVTLTNLQARPLAVLPLSSAWCHGWNVRVADGLGNEHGLIVPPGAAFMPAPDRFRILQPKESMTVTFKFADFSRVNRQTDKLEALNVPATIRVGYVFQAAQELRWVSQRSSLPPEAAVKSSFGPEWTPLFEKADFLAPLQASLKV